jgi:hypothetical protein
MIFHDSLFTKDECENILDIVRNSTDSVDMVIRFDIIGEYRYKTHAIFYNEETKWIIDRMINWFLKRSNLKKNENYKGGDFVINHYSEGDYFGWHIDKCKKYPKRDINLGIILTDDFEGGDYICYDPSNNPIIIPKSVGTVLGYTSEVPHEITEVTSGDRWSLVFIGTNLLEYGGKVI